MRRSDFLSVTGLKRDIFNKLLRDGMIPHAKSPGWGDYSPRSALLTCVSLALAKVSPSQALTSRFVQAEADLIFEKFSELIELESRECWLGFVSVKGNEPDGESGELLQTSYKHPLCGALAEVFDTVAELKAKATQTNHPIELILVDVSQHLRDMIERADLAGMGAAFRVQLGQETVNS